MRIANRHMYGKPSVFSIQPPPTPGKKMLNSDAAAFSNSQDFIGKNKKSWFSLVKILNFIISTGKIKTILIQRWVEQHIVVVVVGCGGGGAWIKVRARIGMRMKIIRARVQGWAS